MHRMWQHRQRKASWDVGCGLRGEPAARVLLVLSNGDSGSDGQSDGTDTASLSISNEKELYIKTRHGIMLL